MKVAKLSQHRRHLDIAEPKCQKTNKEFDMDLRNGFSNLADPTEEDSDINSKCETIIKFYVVTATKVLGYRKRKKKEWPTPGTWQTIEEQR